MLADQSNPVLFQIFDVWIWKSELDTDTCVTDSLVRFTSPFGNKWYFGNIEGYPLISFSVCPVCLFQGCHGIENLDVYFSRQGKGNHRKFP